MRPRHARSTNRFLLTAAGKHSLKTIQVEKDPTGVLEDDEGVLW